MGIIKWITEEVEDAMDFTGDTLDKLTGSEGYRKHNRKIDRKD